ncbi:OmpA family protein [Frigidibacter sp. MR17.14]|uniref:OmpA family protein n=1 Tax=Frigidibacter sp. MR17.14 TaxID=3126509 RepID=UPI003012FF5C
MSAAGLRAAALGLGLLAAVPAAAQTAPTQPAAAQPIATEVPAASAPSAPDLPFRLPPGTEQRATDTQDFGSLRLPAGAWDGSTVPAIVAEGRVTQTAWQVPDITDGTLALLAPLRDQIRDAGFAEVFACDTDGCGGFDFRYASPLLAEPGMHVDLGDYRYLLARRKEGGGDAWIALWVSRSPNHGFVQASLVTPATAPPAPAAGAAAPLPGAPVLDGIAVGTPAPAATGDATAIGSALAENGSLVLADLEFATGSADLADEPFASLSGLADWLKGDPARRVTLVGHSDTEGSAEANRALSAQRAQSVMARLTGPLGVPAGQLAAEGVGYLSPLTSNLTPEGRARNRRVEVVLTSTR